MTVPQDAVLCFGLGLGACAVLLGDEPLRRDEGGLAVGGFAAGWLPVTTPLLLSWPDWSVWYAEVFEGRPEAVLVFGVVVECLAFALGLNLARRWSPRACRRALGALALPYLALLLLPYEHYSTVGTAAALREGGGVPLWRATPLLGFLAVSGAWMTACLAWTGLRLRAVRASSSPPTSPPPLPSSGASAGLALLCLLAAGGGGGCIPTPNIPMTHESVEREPEPYVTATHETKTLVQRWIRAMGEDADLSTPRILVRDDTLAIHTLIDNKSQAVFLPRSPTAREQGLSAGSELIKGPPLVSYFLYSQPVTFLVHEDNPVKTMSVAQMQLVLAGQTTLWLDVGGGEGEITLYSLETSNPVRRAVEREFLAGHSLPEKIRSLPAALGVAKAVSNDVTGLGIGTTEIEPRVRMLGLQTEQAEILLPFFAGKQGRDWPIVTVLRGVTRGTPSPIVRSLFDFASTARGQEIAFQAGYLLLPDDTETPKAVLAPSAAK